MRRCRLKNFKMVTVAAILDIGMEPFSDFQTLCHCDASHQVSAQSDLGCRRRHLGHRNETILAILNLCVTVMPPIKFQLNQT